MKRARDASDAQRVTIDVGGTKVSTTVSTILRSSYLAGMVDLSAWDSDAEHSAQIFLDRDPETFALLLRLMRQYPHVAGLVPHEPGLLASLLAEADFFGYEPLLSHVKARAYFNAREARQDYKARSEFTTVGRLDGESFADRAVRVSAGDKRRKEHIAEIDAKFNSKDESYGLDRFDAVYGTVGDALASGVLPKYYLEPKPPVPPPTKKIVQLMPVDTPCWYLVGDAYEPRFGECGDFVPMHPMSQCITQPGLVRRVACHALVEDQHGTRWMEPMLHLTTKDLEEWMGTQPGDGQGLIFGATLDDCSLKKHTGGVARRTLLASDWFEKMLVPVLCEECGIMETNLWAHVLVAAEPPAEYGFSGGRELGQEAAL